MRPNSVNHGLAGLLSSLMRLDRFLMVLTALVIVFACSRRGGEVSEGTTETRQSAPVERTGRPHSGLSAGADVRDPTARERPAVAQGPAADSSDAGQRPAGRRVSGGPGDLIPRTVTSKAVEPVATLHNVLNEDRTITTGVARGVRVIRDGHDLTPELGMRLLEGDRIVSDEKTQVVIRLEPGFMGFTTRFTTDSDVTLPNRAMLFKLMDETKYRPAGPPMRPPR